MTRADFFVVFLAAVFLPLVETFLVLFLLARFVVDFADFLVALFLLSRCDRDLEALFLPTAFRAPFDFFEPFLTAILFSIS